MKTNIPSRSILLLTAALICLAHTAPATGEGDRLLTVLNPALSNKMAERLPLAPRLDTLQGKTIYLVDMQWGGPEAAYSVYEEMQAWFARNMPSVKTEIRRTAGGPFSDDAALRKEIAEKKVDAVVVGIAG
jgi:hypothetical protein